MTNSSRPSNTLRYHPSTGIYEVYDVEGNRLPHERADWLVATLCDGDSRKGINKYSTIAKHIIVEQVLLPYEI